MDTGSLDGEIYLTGMEMLELYVYVYFEGIRNDIPGMMGSHASQILTSDDHSKTSGGVCMAAVSMFRI